MERRGLALPFHVGSVVSFPGCLISAVNRCSRRLSYPLDGFDCNGVGVVCRLGVERFSDSARKKQQASLGRRWSFIASGKGRGAAGSEYSAGCAHAAALAVEHFLVPRAKSPPLIPRTYLLSASSPCTPVRRVKKQSEFGAKSHRSFEHRTPGCTRTLWHFVFFFGRLVAKPTELPTDFSLFCSVSIA